MNTNWAKILLFSLISFALGFAICCLCCLGGGCHSGGSCEMGMGGGHGSACAHGGGGACMHGGEGKAACCKGGHGDAHSDDGIHTIVSGLEAANFQGDTTIAIEGGTVNVQRTGDKMEVKVEMRDSTEKTVTVDIEGSH